MICHCNVHNANENNNTVIEGRRKPSEIETTKNQKTPPQQGVQKPKTTNHRGQRNTQAIKKKWKELADIPNLEGPTI